ncbi:tagaturonate reductase [Paenibacillus yanchengensis]|uniref:Tagaturonate reductase n=1 Tax=Paenibacillus yanchengensis TaxID=2035833 RepID=A0ABW4YJ67_9BACL
MSTIHLRKDKWTEQQKQLHEQVSQLPIKILQIGEGNFLRGFFDWMIYESRKQGIYDGAIAVTQPRLHGKPKIEALAKQEGAYTLVTRGLDQGKQVEQKEVISVFGAVFDPYEYWEQFLALARNESLRIVVSNTTEAGLVYREEQLQEGVAIQSFPGKLTKLLYERYQIFNGAADKGLICLPCELLERNGDTLKTCVLKYSDDWGYPEAFKTWVVEHNQFLNTLVDRIVTGYPDEAQANAWFEEWGYEDTQLTTAEPYHLWAIEADGSQMEKILPLQQAGLNVHWVDDLVPFQLRKVRILNGAHTLMTPLAILHDKEHVRETMEDERIGAFVRQTVEQEIIPVMPMDKQALQQYAQDVYERFLNPFIRHRLADIAMNSLSKFTTRLLPNYLYYMEQQQSIPSGLLQAFAGLIRYYKVSQAEAGQFVGKTLSGVTYTVRDDEALLQEVAAIWKQHEQAGQSLVDTMTELLGKTNIWGHQLAEKSPELAQQLADIIEEMEGVSHE